MSDPFWTVRFEGKDATYGERRRSLGQGLCSLTTFECTHWKTVCFQHAEELLRWHSARNPALFKTHQRCTVPVEARKSELLSISGDKGRTSNRGRITLSLKNFVDFMESPTRAIGYKSPIVCVERSRRVWIGGFAWSVLAIRYEPLKKYGPPRLGFFVECHGDGENIACNCDTECTLNVVAQQPGKTEITKMFSHKYTLGNHGYMSFAEYEVSPARAFRLFKGSPDGGHLPMLLGLRSRMGRGQRGG